MLLMAGTLALATGAGTALSSGTASAAATTAPGLVTCTTVSGGILISPPLELPWDASYGGPTPTKDTVDIHLGGCTATSDTVTFTGLNGNTNIDGDATGVISSHSNNLEGLAGSSTPFDLTVTWYGTVSGSPIAPTHIQIVGDQAYEGLVNDPGNIGFILGTTTNSGSYVEPSGNPAGFQSFETTSGNDMPAGTYSWPGTATGAPGGSTTVTATPKAGANTTTLCVSLADLGGFAYTQAVSGWNFPGENGAPDSGLLGTVAGNLKDDPVSGTPVPAGDFVQSYSTTSGAGGCGSGNGDIVVGNLAGAPAAKVTSSPSPSAFTLTVGEPLTVSGEPDSMGDLYTSGPDEAGANCGSNPGNYITFEDGSPPDTVCVLKDTGAYSVPGGVGAAAVWVLGTTAHDVPPAASGATVGLAVAGCTSASLTPDPTNPNPKTETSCDYSSATGSFAATAQSASLVGDVTTGFATDNDLELAALGAENGYGGSANPDPQGISFIALIATDGITM